MTLIVHPTSTTMTLTSRPKPSVSRAMALTVNPLHQVGVEHIMHLLKGGKDELGYGDP